MSSDYKDAARALRQVLTRKASVKGAVFGSGARNVKRAYALVTETAIRRDPLMAALKAVPAIAAQLSHVDSAMLLVLAYDHLVGSGIQGGGQLKRLIVENSSALSAAAERGGLCRAEGPSSAHSLLRPRYARVNTLLASPQEVIDALTRASASAAAAVPATDSAARSKPQQPQHKTGATAPTRDRRNSRSTTQAQQTQHETGATAAARDSRD